MPTLRSRADQRKPRAQTVGLAAGAPAVSCDPRNLRRASRCSCGTSGVDIVGFPGRLPWLARAPRGLTVGRHAIRYGRPAVIGHQVEIETVPQRVARTALQLDETGVNGSSFHAQTG